MVLQGRSLISPYSTQTAPGQVMMPEAKDSFALIYSIENPAGNSTKSGIGAQVMGPRDGYMIQYDYDVRKFWASSASLTLGSCFETRQDRPRPRRVISKAGHLLQTMYGIAGFRSLLIRRSQQDFRRLMVFIKDAYCRMKSAPQVFLIMACVHRLYSSLGHIEPSVDRCQWCFDVKGVTGWGDVDKSQKPTAGWLATLPVFEPGWQVKHLILSVLESPFRS